MENAHSKCLCYNKLPWYETLFGLKQSIPGTNSESNVQHLYSHKNETRKWTFQMFTRQQQRRAPAFTITRRWRILSASRAKSGPRLLWLAWHVATPWASQTVLVEAKRTTTATGDGTNAVLNQNVTTDNFSCRKWSIGHAILQAQMSTSMPDCGSKRRTLRAAQCTSEGVPQTNFAICGHQTCSTTWSYGKPRSLLKVDSTIHTYMKICPNPNNPYQGNNIKMWHSTCSLANQNLNVNAGQWFWAKDSSGSAVTPPRRRASPSLSPWWWWCMMMMMMMIIYHHHHHHPSQNTLTSKTLSSSLSPFTYERFYKASALTHITLYHTSSKVQTTELEIVPQWLTHRRCIKQTQTVNTHTHT